LAILVPLSIYPRTYKVVYILCTPLDKRVRPYNDVSKLKRIETMSKTSL